MSSNVKVFKIKDFVRKKVSGELDLEKSLDVARKFGALAYLYSEHNILLDLRDTTISDYQEFKITDLMRITLEIAEYIPGFKNKIANIIPDDDERKRVAKKFKACMTLKHFTYEVFTDFEEAMEWFAEP